MKWVGSTKPLRWQFKKNMPANLQLEAIHIDFRFERVWIARDINGRVLMPGNQGRMPTFEFFLNTGGHVIGPRDCQAAIGEPWAFEWQTACADRISESLQKL